MEQEGRWHSFRSNKKTKQKKDQAQPPIAYVHCFYSCMEAEDGAAACCEDEWGVAAWDTVSDRQEFFILFNFFCLFLLRCPVMLLWPEISVCFWTQTQRLTQPS